MSTEATTLKQPLADLPTSSDVERLITTGDKLLRAQQAQMSAERASYERRRTERLSFYRMEMQRIADEAEHELLMLDRAWSETQRKMQLVIGKLKAMRAA